MVDVCSRLVTTEAVVHVVYRRVNISFFYTIVTAYNPCCLYAMPSIGEEIEGNHLLFSHVELTWC